ncbi:MAG: SOS response-associated peptidase [Bacteroidales bacterium]|nr:SOS response-associated peptidase [Bacteroidales bacterium]
MCYTININLTREQIEKRFGVKFNTADEYTRGKKVTAFSLPKVPVIPSTHPEEAQSMIWGLIPSWARDNENAKAIRMKTFNAKAETLHEKPAFRNSFKSKRCIVPVNGFYEWQHAGKEKIPYHITLKDNEIFGLAGLYDEWADKGTGELLRTFTIITTPANAMMEVIHNTKKRMPAILAPFSEKKWLEETLSANEINAILRPFDENLMTAERITEPGTYGQGSLF